MKEILVMLNEISEEEFTSLCKRLSIPRKSPKYSPPIENYDIQSVHEHSTRVNEGRF